MSITVAQCLSAAQIKLRDCSGSPEIDSQYLLMHVLKKPRSFLVTSANNFLSEKQATAFEGLLTRRLQGEPIAYLIGEQGFWKHVFKTTPDTLIPRPETELIIEAALQFNLSAPNILDLGTGTGILAITLADEIAAASVYASDFSTGALSIAQQNAQYLQQKVEFRCGDWCEPWQDKQAFFDVIVSNPPYIQQSDPHLLMGDVRFEPRLALVAGLDGLSAIRNIVEASRKLLKKSGWLLIEHGFDQGQAVRDIFTHNSYCYVETIKDLNGHDRVCKGQWI